MKNDDALDALIATAKRHDVPPDDAEAHAWAGFVGALGGGGGGGGPGGEAGTPAADLASAAKAASVAKAIAAVAVAAAAVVGVARWSQPEPEATTDTPRAAATAIAPEDPPAPGRRPAPLPPVSIQAVPPAPPHAPATVEQPRKARSTPEPGPPAAASTLAEEARLVGAIWKAIDRGDSDAALSLASRYGRDFEAGKLRAEARAAALVARCNLGKPINLAELESLRASASPSVAKRLSSACGEEP